MAFGKVMKYIRFLDKQNKRKESSQKKDESNNDQKDDIKKEIELNSTNLYNALRKSDDVIIRNFSFGIKTQTKAFVCFIDGLGDKSLIDEYVIKPLMYSIHVIVQDDKLLAKDIFTLVKENILNSVEMQELSSFNKVLEGILGGNTALFIDGYEKALVISAKGAKTRNVEEPGTESVVRGPREGFTETLRVNTSLIRRKIANPKLTFEAFTIGKQTHTDINIAYIEGIASKKTIEEVRSRLNSIDTDSILESGYIEQYIEDHPFSPFPTIGNSEKPDKVAAKLLEGRVAIICNGTPVVLTVPNLFIEAFQAPEDYYARPYVSSLLRLFRLMGFFITLTLPALYVALVTFHPEAIPTVLLITAAASREGIPFPTMVETLINVVLFDLLRESGVRLPKQVGQAVSIVGTLVIGQAAVEAGLISAPMVIISALTGIASFVVIPVLDPTIIFRYIFILLSGTFGLYGLCLGLLFLLAHMCSLRSFGTPYTAPFAPVQSKGLKDSFIRMPFRNLKSRPKAITWRDSERQGSGGDNR